MQISPFPERAVILVSGRDRVAFLQGQLTQDVAALAPERAQLAAFLSPQGRALALARLVARGESIALVVPAAIAAALLERLKKYVLRAKVTIAPDPALALGAVLEEAPGELDARFGPASPGSHQPLADGASLVRLGGRALLLAPSAALAALVDAAPEPLRWERAAIAAGDPLVHPATAEHWTAHMLNLDRLQALSFTKGCYTGQEVVARTQHLGRSKRRMLRYRLRAAAPAPGAPLLAGTERVGEVVRSAPTPDGAELLAVITLEARGRELTTADGAVVAELPLPYAID
jgi:folate-binding protein YgfZ